jgi:hypothetical protein
MGVTDAFVVCLCRSFMGFLLLDEASDFIGLHIGNFDVSDLLAMIRSPLSPASLSMARTVFGPTSHRRAVARTDVPSTRQRRIRITVSFGSRTSAPNGFSCGSMNRLPHRWHL